MGSKKTLFLGLVACIAAGGAWVARAAVDPSATTIKVYKFAVSTDPFCSSPITVFSSDSPVETDLADNPVVGTGPLEDGTYECVMIEMSDVIGYVPSATDGACTQGTEFSKSVCDGDSRLLDGTPVSCSDAGDRVVLYLSTASTVGTPEQYVAAGCADEAVDCSGFSSSGADRTRARSYARRAARRERGIERDVRGRLDRWSRRGERRVLDRASLVLVPLIAHGAGETPVPGSSPGLCMSHGPRHVVTLTT